MSSYCLFLDDERSIKNVTWVTLPPGPWDIVRSYDEFVKVIKENGIPKFISFDHDLGVSPATTQSDIDLYNTIIHRSLQGNEIDYKLIPAKTGYHCAQWLVQYCMDAKFPIPPYTVHSMNPIGAENIRSLMENAIAFQEMEMGG